MGEIGYDDNKFLHELNWWQIRAIIRGYRKRERSLWLATRWQTWVTAKLMGSDSESPEDFMPLPYDTTDKPAVNNEEEKEKLQKLIEEARKYNQEHQNKEG